MSKKPPASLQEVSITVAPNGGRRSKADHPALPVTASELARTANECLAAGAAMLHLHIRDAQGGHLLDGEGYRQTIRTIEAVTGDRLIIQITTEAVDRYAPAQQMAVAREARAEAVSLALRELVPDSTAETEFAAFLLWLKREAIVPQIILYSREDALRLAGLHQRGIIPWNSIPVLYVLGRYTRDQRSEPRDLLAFLAPHVPRFDHWSVCAFGRKEAACVTTGALLGGHVRVGFENNLQLPDGTIAASNADLVGSVTDILRRCGCGVLDAQGLRESWATSL